MESLQECVAYGWAQERDKLALFFKARSAPPAVMACVAVVHYAELLHERGLEEAEAFERFLRELALEDQAKE